MLRKAWSANQHCHREACRSRSVMQLGKRELFGGAITLELPLNNLIDASTLREVPDTQEVFLHTDCTASWIIEILQRVDIQDPSEAARYHFGAIAHDNDATDVEIREIQPLSSATPAGNTPVPVICVGWQEVAKYNRTEPDKVEIVVAVYRLQAQNIDIVLSLNLPYVLADGTRTPDAIFQEIQGSFKGVAQSLNILDFGLFA